MRISRTTAAVCFTLSLLVPAARSQSTYGSIVGDVRDSSAAIVGGAALTLTNLATSERHAAATDKDGFVQFPNLSPATYRLEAQMSGFQRYIKEPILIEV